jgi:hypothetical protein
MGEIVGAGLLAHVPTIVLPLEIRKELNNGEDFTLVAGLEQLRKDVVEKVVLSLKVIKPAIKRIVAFMCFLICFVQEYQN